MTDVSNTTENNGDDEYAHIMPFDPAAVEIYTFAEWVKGLAKVIAAILYGVCRRQFLCSIAAMRRELWQSGLQMFGVGIDPALKEGLRHLAGSPLPRSPADDRPLLYAYGCAAAEQHLAEALQQQNFGRRLKRREHLLLTLRDIPGQRVPWQDDAAYLKGFCDTLGRYGVAARYRIFYRCEEVKLKRLATLLTRKGTEHKLYAQICLPLEPESWLEWSLLPNLWPAPPEPDMATA